MTHPFSTAYTDSRLDHIAFHLGGHRCGHGVRGRLRRDAPHLAVTHPDVNHEPYTYSAISATASLDLVRVLEGPVPRHPKLT